MKIIVKSTPENWEKECSGKKPCIVRKLDKEDIIEIVNTENKKTMQATITDITTWKDDVIISFKDPVTDEQLEEQLKNLDAKLGIPKAITG